MLCLELYNHPQKFSIQSYYLKRHKAITQLLVKKFPFCMNTTFIYGFYTLYQKHLALILHYNYVLGNFENTGITFSHTSGAKKPWYSCRQYRQGKWPGISIQNHTASNLFPLIVHPFSMNVNLTAYLVIFVAISK